MNDNQRVVKLLADHYQAGWNEALEEVKEFLLNSEKCNYERIKSFYLWENILDKIMVMEKKYIRKPSEGSK